MTRGPQKVYLQKDILVYMQVYSALIVFVQASKNVSGMVYSISLMVQLNYQNQLLHMAGPTLKQALGVGY